MLFFKSTSKSELQYMLQYSHSTDGKKNKTKQLSESVKTLEYFGEILTFAKKKNIMFNLF